MTFEERLAALEAAAAASAWLPGSLATLQRKLEQGWQPDASVLVPAALTYGVYGMYTGAWSTSAATSTSGTAFSAPVGGDYLMLWGASAFMTTATAAGSVEAYIDGVLRDTLTFTFNALNVHNWMGVQPIRITLAAGTHYFYIKDATANLTSDANDHAFMAGIKVT